MTKEHSFLLFSGSSHPELASEIASNLNVKLGNLSISAFPDAEIGIEILENVRGRDVFALQTIARRPNHYLMELLITIDALKRASAKSICAVIPYFGYARQDRKAKGRAPITAKLVADLLEKAGATHLLTMDMHAEQIQGFFDIPVDHLYARPIFVDAVKKLELKECVVVAPDLGSIQLARAFSQELEVNFAIVDKRRIDAELVEPGVLIGNVENKDVLLVDDMVSTGKTLQKAAAIVKKQGANRVFAVVTHGLFAGNALEDSAIEKVLVTNTIPQGKNQEIVSVAPLFSQAIDAIVSATSISSLHTQKN